MHSVWPRTRPAIAPPRPIRRSISSEGRGVRPERSSPFAEVSAMLDTVKDLLAQLSEHKDVVVPILSFLGGFVTLATTVAARRTYRISESHTYNPLPAVSYPPC